MLFLRAAPEPPIFRSSSPSLSSPQADDMDRFAAPRAILAAFEALPACSDFEELLMHAIETDMIRQSSHYQTSGKKVERTASITSDLPGIASGRAFSRTSVGAGLARLSG